MKDIIDELLDKNKFQKILPEEYLKFLNQHIIPEYKINNEQSLQSQTNFKFWGSIVFIASFLAIAIVGLGISLYEQIPKLIFIIELIFLVCILTAFIATRRSASHNNWINSRLKAEQLRIYIFSIISTKSHIYFESAEDDLKILKKINNKVQLGEIEDLKEYIIGYWLNTQKEYHSNKEKNFRKKEEVIKYLIRATYILAIIVSLLHLFFTSHLYENILILFVLILPAFGATLVGIKSHRDYSSISLNSKYMKEEIDKLIREIRDSKNYEELFKTINKIEWLFINELKRWEIIIKSREIELGI